MNTPGFRRVSFMMHLASFFLCRLRTVPGVLLCAAVGLLGLSLPVAAQEAGRGVYVIPIHGTIDLGLAGFVKRGMAAAEEAQASHIILDIETFGGRVDAAVRIRDTILASDIVTVAYVNPRAISAGALISLACDEIYMAGGGTIGAASPVSIGGAGQAQALGEKEVSYVRTEFRATAERNGYSPLIAEAMVDKDATVAVFTLPDGVRVVPVDRIEAVAKELGQKPGQAKTYSAAGKLLTMTTDDAIAIGLAKARADSLEQLMELLGTAGWAVTKLQSTWSENLVRFLTHPIVSGLLLTLGSLGLIIELRAPGWGLPGSVGVIALMLFFGAQYLVGLAEVQEVLLLAIGLGLLLVEVFVLPGFGAAGVLGVVCLVGAIYLALVDVPIPQYSWDFDRVGDAGTTILTALLAGFASGALLWRYLPKSRFGRSLVLAHELAAEDGYTGVALEQMPELGATGTAYTVLRPAGRVQIGDRLVDAQTEGGFIEEGTPVRVLQILGNAVVVEPVNEAHNA